MTGISRRNLVLLLLGISPQGGVMDGLGGITRVQKYLFLLEHEQEISPSGDGFEFAPYKAGPYSPRIYDDLQFLENLGFLQSEPTSEATEAEAAEIDMLSFEDLMGDEAETSGEETYDGLGATDAYEERRYTLTEQGRTKIQELLAREEYQPVIDGIRRVKSRYASYSLSDLLYHVYTKYPDMTLESEIKDKVLKSRRR